MRYEIGGIVKTYRKNKLAEIGYIEKVLDDQCVIVSFIPGAKHLYINLWILCKNENPDIFKCHYIPPYKVK